ncbi:MAG TPA: hypothetical protein VFH44_11665 [Solirubrobacterales bacterium]|nr:hypothetical protein [Solirubrobacterales bacterium]
MSWESIRRCAAGALAVGACSALAAPGASASVPSKFFGIFAEAPAASEFEEMAAAGFRTYRLPVNWARVQPTRHGGYEFDRVDHQIIALGKAGMRALPVVYGTPPFVHAPPENPGERVELHPPVRRADLVEWRRFNAALARRYGPHGKLARDPALTGYRPVRSWIIWNEQNATFNWQPRPKPRQYARLVKFAHAGLTRVNRRAEVVLGGMFGFPLASRSINAARYLRQLYRVRRFKRRFDAVNVHPYAASAALAIDQIRNARSVMKRAGDRRTPIIVGEIGWSSFAVGQDGQARRHATFLRRIIARRHRWRIEGAFIYVWRDIDTVTSCFWCPTAGLVAVDGAPKPALTKVSGIIAGATDGGRRPTRSVRGADP